jgi:hypothetical protein
MKYLMATYKAIDTLVGHPKTNKVVYVETHLDIVSLVSAYLEEFHWDEILVKVDVDFDKRTVDITTTDKGGTAYPRRQWYLIPIERFAA